MYPKETVGLIFGIRTPSGYRCSLAIPLQVAHRDYFGVSWDLLHQERVKKAVFSMMGYKFLGIYHSHPGGSTVPSDEDLRALIDNNYCLDIVSGIKKSIKGEKPPWSTSGLGIKGIVQNFEIVIDAFVNEVGKAYQIKIDFPSMDIYNILAEELDISLFDIIDLPDYDLKIAQYKLRKIDYHLMRRKGSYSKQKIDYHFDGVKKILSKYSKKPTMNLRR